MNKIDLKSCLLVVALVAASFNVRAGEQPAANPYSGVLSAVTRVEMPAKAAELIAQADVKNQKQITVDVVKAAVGLNPAAAPVVVGSIAQTTPKMAATAAAAAVVLVPDQAVAIARAAAAAAPASAAQIVELVCRALPTSYEKVAMAVAEVVPGSDRQILSAVATAIPSLKNSIAQVMLANHDAIPSVSAVLPQVSATDMVPVFSQTPVTTMARGPSQGGPFVPISGTPKVTTPSSGGVTPAPADYSQP